MLYDVGQEKNPPSLRGTVEKMTLDKHGDELRKLLFLTAYRGDIHALVEIVKKGVSVDTVEETTGMTALHYAAGRDDLNLTKFLVQSKAAFLADKEGRWPTTVAAMVGASDELCDYIAEAEAATARV